MHAAEDPHVSWAICELSDSATYVHHKASWMPMAGDCVRESCKVIGGVAVTGDARVFSSATLALVSWTRAAHMVFATAVAFDRGHRALLSVSADASAHLTLISPPRKGVSWVTLLLLLLLLLLLAAVAVWALGLDVRLQQALEQLGIKPGELGEL